jgi:hypothetical protein
MQDPGEQRIAIRVTGLDGDGVLGVPNGGIVVAPEQLNIPVDEPNLGNEGIESSRLFRELRRLGQRVAPVRSQPSTTSREYTSARPA